MKNYLIVFSTIIILFITVWFFFDQHYIEGCTDSLYMEYDSIANIDNGSCETLISDYLCENLIEKDFLEKRDWRNRGIEISICYKSLEKKNIIIDINSVSNKKSRNDIFRCLLQIAEKLRNQQFKKVELACKGKSKFYITGKYFEKLGKEYSWQNPIYTQRTLPENIKNMNGTNAFSTWTGGRIGVMNRQLDDVLDFHDEWYWNDLGRF